MKDLLKEYNKTRRETIKRLNDLEEKLQYIIRVKPKKSNSKIEDPSTEEIELLQEIEIVRDMLSSINYVIQWLRTGSQPNRKRGVERRSAYEREISFENYWIQRKKDERTIDTYLIIENEEEEISTEEFNQKARVIKDITRNLTDRQQTMLTLVANGYSHSEIADLLSVSKGTVDVTIARTRSKIENEGWFMP